MPSPPPPYSPGQSQNLSQAAGASPHMSSNAFAPSQPVTTTAGPAEYIPSAPSRPVSIYDYNPSRPTSMAIPASATSVTSAPAFPPPPPRNARERSLSRDKSHSKFSLSAFRNRTSDHSPAPSNIENLRISTSEAISRAPASPGLRASQTYVYSKPVKIELKITDQREDFCLMHSPIGGIAQSLPSGLLPPAEPLQLEPWLLQERVQEHQSSILPPLRKRAGILQSLFLHLLPALLQLAQGPKVWVPLQIQFPEGRVRYPLLPPGVQDRELP